MSREVMITTKVWIPTTPNFIKFSNNPDALIDIKDLSEKELREIGAAWTQDLVNKALARQNDSNLK